MNNIGCGERIDLQKCRGCGNGDLSVTRGLCGYCTVVTPEKLDKICCRECQEFKAVSEFDSVGGIVTTPVCFECEDFWDDAYTNHLEVMAQESVRNSSMVN